MASWLSSEALSEPAVRDELAEPELFTASLAGSSSGAAREADRLLPAREGCESIPGCRDIGSSSAKRSDAGEGDRPRVRPSAGPRTGFTVEGAAAAPAAGKVFN
jgi:hypothetical protein